MLHTGMKLEQFDSKRQRMMSGGGGGGFRVSESHK